MSRIVRPSSPARTGPRGRVLELWPISSNSFSVYPGRSGDGDKSLSHGAAAAEIGNRPWAGPRSLTTTLESQREIRARQAPPAPYPLRRSDPPSPSQLPPSWRLPASAAVRGR